MVGLSWCLSRRLLEGVLLRAAACIGLEGEIISMRMHEVCKLACYGSFPDGFGESKSLATSFCSVLGLWPNLQTLLQDRHRHYHHQGIA